MSEKISNGQQTGLIITGIVLIVVSILAAKAGINPIIPGCFIFFGILMVIGGLFYSR